MSENTFTTAIDPALLVANQQPRDAAPVDAIDLPGPGLALDTGEFVPAEALNQAQSSTFPTVAEAEPGPKYCTRQCPR